MVCVVKLSVNRVSCKWLVTSTVHARVCINVLMTRRASASCLPHSDLCGRRGQKLLATRTDESDVNHYLFVCYVITSHKHA